MLQFIIIEAAWARWLCKVIFINHTVTLLGPAVGQYTIKFILPEFVSYLGERGVLCVGNGWHFCTSVLILQSHIHDAQLKPEVTEIRAVRRCASMNFVRI